MNRLRPVIITIIALTVFYGLAQARYFRVDQVPNGNKYGCLTCHNGYGGPRNPFGQEIEANFLDNPSDKSNANVQWGPELAALDSDGDSASNGEELQDPNGEWMSGQINPGETDLVSNPGDPESTTNINLRAFALPGLFELEQNYPNPFNPSTTIAFQLPQHATVTLRIYNALGEPVRTLANERLSAGSYSLTWDGLNDSGEPLGSGIYMAQLQSGNETTSIRMLKIK